MKNLTLTMLVVCLMGFACERELSGTAPRPTEKICNDDIDNDSDGKTDCDDTDCDTSSHCTGGDPEILCDDDIDNDADGAVDCDDTDCASAENCAVPQENCVNGVDDDRDGLVDCDDPDCESHTSCNDIDPEEICDDGLDNDLDGPIDCDDADCAEATNCLPSVEVCTDGVDNDLDGFVDCEDVDCASHQACQPVCGDGVIEGNEQCEGTDFDGETCVSKGFDGGSLRCVACVISTAYCTECGDGICEGTETEANCPADCDEGPVCGNGVRESGEVCDGASLGGATCLSVLGQAYIGTLACNASCSGFVTSACVCADCVEFEDCDNGQDDDGDGFIDCDDADCWSEAACQVAYCGDGSCNGSETQANCPADCGGTCGNGILNAGEACDGSNLNGKTCSTLGMGYTGGSLSCTASCTFNTVNCTSSMTENCSNGLDDDRDGLIDWLDPSCSTSYSAERHCSDGIDNDSDGYTDCQDHDCAAADVCRFGTAGGDTYLVAVPGTGTRNFGGVGMDHPSFWSTARATGRALMVNVEKYYSALAAYYYGATYTWSTCSPSAIKAFARTPAVDWSVFQLQCVSPSSGACANMAIYVGCSVNPGTGLQTQANFLILMDRNDSAQQAWRNSQMPNGQWEEIASGQSAISMLTWYRNLTPQ